MNFDFENFAKTMESIVDFLKTFTGILKWLNDNIMPLFGTVVDFLMKALDFVLGLFKPDGFLGGIIDFIMNLFG